MKDEGEQKLVDALARMQREIQPAQDLWPGIESRLKPRRGSGGTHRTGFPGMGFLGMGIAAAVATVAVVLLVTMQEENTLPVVAGAGASTSGIFVTPDPGVRLASETMLDALSGPDAESLPPETLALVRENLLIIDKALREISEALELDPGNEGLQRQLLDTYRGHSRLIEQLMQTQIVTESRKDI